MEESCGSFLKRQREMRKVRLEQIAQTTRVSLHCLEALEAEDWDKMPPPVFVRGFVRLYAQSIGLNPEEGVLRFDADVKRRREGQEAEQTWKQETPPKPLQKERPTGWIYLLVLAGVITLGILISFL